MHFNFYIHEGQILGNTVNTGEASMNKNSTREELRINCLIRVKVFLFYVRRN